MPFDLQIGGVPPEGFFVLMRLMEAFPISFVHDS